VLVSIVVGAVFFVCAFFIPKAYNYPDNVRLTATRLMQICAVVMPIDVFAHATYFTLRSGGQVFITILFDSVYMWVVNVPVAFLLMEYTTLPFLVIYALCHAVNILKCFLGAWLVKKGIWIRTIVE
jgi:Na+-driven multidrug efflux pump